MAEAHSVSRAVTGAPDKTLTFETGKLAGQADGAVTVRLGDTVVLVTATASKAAREGADFFPLTVDIEERMYAAGKIPGSFFRREGKASDQAILTCRLIDRPLRPCFPDGFRNEVHVVGTILGADLTNPHDVVAINGASAALSLSGIPFEGPIGAVRVAFSTDGEWIPFPTYEEGESSTFELVVAGRLLDDDDVAIMMVEAGGTETAWPSYEAGAPKVTEEVLAAGLEASKTWIRESINDQLELIEAAGGRKPEMAFSTLTDYTHEVFEAVAEVGHDRVTAAESLSDKAERLAAEEQARSEVIAELADRFAELRRRRASQIKAAFRSLTKAIVRKRIVEEGVRIDGRGTRDIRPLSAEVGVLPSVHGSGLFQRGETQVLNVTTLGMPRMEQMLDTLGVVDRKRYMHHYNFPPYSTGETGFMRGPEAPRDRPRHAGRAGAGAGAALQGGVRLHHPHRVRRHVVQRLHLDGLGVRLDPVADGRRRAHQGAGGRHRHGPGVRRGQVHHPDRHPGRRGRLRRHGLQGGRHRRVRDRPPARHQDRRHPRRRVGPGARPGQGSPAQDPGRDGRRHRRAPRRGGPHRPQDRQLRDPDRQDRRGHRAQGQGHQRHPAGDRRRHLRRRRRHRRAGQHRLDRLGAVQEAERQIKLILNPPTANVGQTYKGKVVNVTKFGAFVNILPGRDGLIHISKLGGGKRIDRVEDVVDLGDEIEVVVDDVDPNGKVSLALAGSAPAAKPREGRADRDDRPARNGGSDDASDGGADREYVSFEDAFDDEVRSEFGDLGPAAPAGDRGGDRGGRSGGGGSRGGRGRGGDRGGRRR